MSFPMRRQTTLDGVAVVEGSGYWSGQEVRVEFRPASTNDGIEFVRDDLSPAVRIPAKVVHGDGANRRTVLTADGTRVEMVEHALAALSGLGIDNCQVHVDAPELPGCDGSSWAFVEAIERAGIVELEAPIQPIVIDRHIQLRDGDAWVEATPGKPNCLSIEYQLEYAADGPIGSQRLALDLTPDTFRSELAASRTFLLLNEAEQLRASGLGDKVTPRDLLIFDDDGPLENELRFDDECVRHKILDLVGDLALAGQPIFGNIRAHRSGHRLNAALVAEVLSQLEATTALSHCA